MKNLALVAVLTTAIGTLCTAQDTEGSQGGFGGGEQLVHLRVEWEPVRMVWDAGHRDRSSRWLAISGRVLREEPGEDPVPIAWGGDARVLIARQPGENPRWSESIHPRDTLILQISRLPVQFGEPDFFDDWYDEGYAVKIGEDGIFHAKFHPMEVRRLVGQTGMCQLGLVLSRNPLRWDFFERGEGQLIEKSVATVSVNGPDPLPPTQAIINGAPPPLARYYEPVGLIRAVNHLHSLGFEAAVRELRDFLGIAQYGFGLEPARGAVPENPDIADRAKLFLILRLLFEPKDPTSKPFPDFQPGMMMASPDEPYPGELYPLVLAQDMPFFMPRWRWARSGPDPGPDFILEWVVEHGRLREMPLRPPDDPFAALEELESLRDGEPPFLPRGNDARRQVWLALEEVTGQPVPESRYPSLVTASASPISEARWQNFRDVAAALELYWDEGHQSYRSRVRDRESAGEDDR